MQGKDVWKSMGSPATPTAVQVHGRLDLMRKKSKGRLQRARLRRQRVKLSCLMAQLL